MNYYERIQNAINFIENNLENDIKVEDMAREAYMSLSSFYRMFFSITGFQAKEYLINRRMCMACSELNSDKVKVIDIAIKYAYNSVYAFSRIFKKTTGYTPKTCAKEKHKYNFERIDIMNKYFINNENSDDYPDIKILSSLDKMQVAYCSYYGKNPEDGAFAIMKRWVKQNNIDYTDDNYRIFGYNTPDSNPSNDEYGYEVCVTIPNDLAVNDEQIKVKFLEKGQYAVISIDPKDNIGEQIMLGWERFSKWLKDSKFSYGDNQWLEEHLGFGEEFQHLGGVDLYMPIKEK